MPQMSAEEFKATRDRIRQINHELRVLGGNSPAAVEQQAGDLLEEQASLTQSLNDLMR